MDSLCSMRPRNPSFILKIGTPPGTKSASLNISHNTAFTEVAINKKWQMKTMKFGFPALSITIATLILINDFFFFDTERNKWGLSIKSSMF